VEAGCDARRRKDERRELTGAFRDYGNVPKNLNLILRRISVEKKKKKKKECTKKNLNNFNVSNINPLRV